MFLCRLKDPIVFDQGYDSTFLCIDDQPRCFISNSFKKLPILRPPTTIHKLPENPALTFYCSFNLPCYPGWILVIKTENPARDIRFYYAVKFICKNFNHLVCIKTLESQWPVSLLERVSYRLDARLRVIPNCSLIRRRTRKRDV